jgi:hypothetical protein
MTKDLSKTMYDAIDKAIKCNGLIRRPGGFWSGEKTIMLPLTTSHGIHYENEPTTYPEWYFSTGTIKSLVKRGIFKETKFMSRGDAYFVEFTIKARSVYKMPNGMVCTFGPDGKQIGPLQGEYTPELHELIKKWSDENTVWTGF